MRPFRVLLVDDEDDERKKGLQLNHADDVEIVVSDSLESARQEARESFFHLALVDLQLDEFDDQNIDGQIFLRELLEGRPSCRRVLFTRTSSKHRGALFGLLDPDGAVIDGAVDKTNYERIWQEWVQEQAERWRQPALEIEGLEKLAASLSDDIVGSPAFGGERATVTPAELEYLVVSLFRSEKRPASEKSARADVAPFAVDQVALEPLAGGQSKAAVLLARLASGDSAARVACVLKVAPREESFEECERYERLVKFRVAPDRRAELLGDVQGDTVGGVVYAFAGESPERVRDMNAFFTEESGDAFPILAELFGAKGDDLWRELKPEVPVRPIDLGGYFYREYRLRPDAVGAELDRYALKRAKGLGFAIEGTELVANGGAKLALPNEDFYGGANVRRPYVETFIHGDLNARNVLVSDDGRVRLIDFRYANFGPVATDFAALEASVRLCCCATPASARSLIGDAAEERRLHSRAWSDSGRPSRVDPPYWAAVSQTLTSLARENSPMLTREEYLATCLLYALRVARVSTLAEHQRMRMIAWVSTLSAALKA